MTIKETKAILHFLKRYQAILNAEKHPELNTFFQHFFSREELLAILNHTYCEETVERHPVEHLSKNKLLELINDDYYIIRYLIYKLEASLTKTPELSQQEVCEIFDQLPVGAHYLRDKPVNDWDSYDRSNYLALLAKHGKVQKVYAIFSNDVPEEDKYRVTTPPELFFDTETQAKEALKRMCSERKIPKDELKVMSLWRIC